MRKTIIYSCIVLLACGKPSQNSQLENGEKVELPNESSTQLESAPEGQELKVNLDLVDPFYRHETINLDNPDLISDLVESYKFDLDEDGILDSIKLFRIRQLETDPGDFHRIVVKLSNGKTLDELNIDGWIRGNNHQPRENEIDSDLITIAKYKNLTFLMCFGWYYASDPPQLTIFEFSRGKPKIVFHKNFAISNLILDERAVLAGNKQYKQGGSEVEPELYELGFNNGSLELRTGSNNQ